MNTERTSHVKNADQPTNLSAGGVLKRKCACGNHTIAGGECAKCQKSKSVEQRSYLLQPKLKVSQPNDKYELEADRVAEQVMRMSAPKEKKVSEEDVQIKLRVNHLSQRQQKTDLDEDTLLAKANLGYTSQVPSNVAVNIQNLRGGGIPLPPKHRYFFESRMGQDFSDVRIHTDAKAADAAQAIQAKAFTLGNDIVFNAGQYSPDNQEGKKLLAHELTHVVQQNGTYAAGRKREPTSFTNELTPTIQQGASKQIIQRQGPKDNAASNDAEIIKELQEIEKYYNEEVDFSLDDWKKNNPKATKEEILEQTIIIRMDVITSLRSGSGVAGLLKNVSVNDVQNYLVRREKKITKSAQTRVEKVKTSTTEYSEEFNKVWDEILKQAGLSKARIEAAIKNKSKDPEMVESLTVQLQHIESVMIFHKKDEIKRYHYLFSPKNEVTEYIAWLKTWPSFDNYNASELNEVRGLTARYQTRLDVYALSLAKQYHEDNLDVDLISELLNGGSTSKSKKDGESGAKLETLEPALKADKSGGQDKKAKKGSAGKKSEDMQRVKDLLKNIPEDKQGEKVDHRELKKILEIMSDEEFEAFKNLLEESKAEIDSGMTLQEVLTLYAKLDPVKWEILKTNAALLESDNGELALTEEIMLAITKTAKKNIETKETVTAFNDTLDTIWSQVNESDPNKKNVKPINPEDMYFFNAVMMFQGLMAGAARENEEIGGVSKQLNSNIGEITDYIVDEMIWLSAELAAGTAISMLLAPVSGGASLVVQGAMGAKWIYRINKLRKLMVKISQIFDVYSKVVDSISAVESAFASTQKLQKFLDDFSVQKEKMEELINLLAVDDLTDVEEAALELKLEALEAELTDTLMEKIDKELEPLVDKFYLPDDIGEEELQKVLFNIPAGMTALKELQDFYDPGRDANLEYATLLSLKGVKAGSLLYPFVGYLVSEVNDALAGLLQEKDLMDRFEDLFSDIKPGKKRKKRGGKKKDETNKDRFKKAGKKDAKTKKEQKKDSANTKSRKKYNYNSTDSKASIEKYLEKYADKFEVYLNADKNTLHKGLMTPEYYREIVTDYKKVLLKEANGEKVKARRKLKGGNVDKKHVAAPAPPFKLEGFNPDNTYTFDLKVNPKARVKPKDYNNLDYGDFSKAVPYGDSVLTGTAALKKDKQEALDKWLAENGYQWTKGLNDSGRLDSSEIHIRKKNAPHSNFLQYKDNKIQQGLNKQAYKKFLGKKIHADKDLPPGYHDPIKIEAKVAGMTDLSVDSESHLVAGDLDIPATHVTQSSGSKSEWVEAKPLTNLKGNTTGSSATGSVVGLPGWTIANHINKTRSNTAGKLTSPWVKAHLLNEQMHGPAVKWNLVTGSKTLNNVMRDQVEDKANKKRRQGDVLYYKTNISYYPKNDPITVTAGSHTVEAKESDFPNELKIKWGVIKNKKKQEALAARTPEAKKTIYEDEKSYNTATTTFNKTAQGVRLPTPEGINAKEYFESLKTKAEAYYNLHEGLKAGSAEKKEKCTRTAFLRYMSWHNQPTKKQDLDIVGKAKIEQLYQLGLGEGKPGSCYEAPKMKPADINNLIVQVLQGRDEDSAISADKVKLLVSAKQQQKNYAETPLSSIKKMLNEILNNSGTPKVCKKMEGRSSLYYICPVKPLK